MLKNLSLIALLATVLTACQTSKNLESQKEESPAIEEQIVEEENFEVIQDEEQAQAMNQEKEVKTVEVQDRVFFSYDSAQISAASKKILDVQAQWLNNNPKINIKIEGHCDERGTREYNIALGQKRANAVKNYLEEKGVDSSRMKTISYGKERPAFFGLGEKIHSKNRRAVVVVK